MQKTVQERIHLIESIADHAWPAKVQKEFGEWRARATDGVTKRANSVYTIGSLPRERDWLGEIESFYQKQGLTPCYYISSLTPEEVDPLLEAKGYQKLGELYLMVATIEQTAKVEQASIERKPNFAVHLATEASPSWIENFLRLEGFPPSRFEAYATIFSAIKLKKNFLSLYREEKLVALGTVVVAEGWGCLSNIVVDESERRQGIASQLLMELSACAQAQGAEHLFLQVVKENRVSLGLYTKLGFAPISKSHFRSLG